MISRQVKLQLVIFLVLSAAGIIYTGFDYLGIHPLHGPYTITVHLADGGGIFTNAEVDERGLVVGKVDSLRVLPHDSGIAVDLAIDPQFKVPQNTDAVVADLSAVGEQYVDLEPQSAGPPYLKPGGVIPESRTQIPLNNAVLLTNLDRLVKSVPLHQLDTVITQLGDAFQGTGPALQRLIDAGDALTQDAQANLPNNVALMNVSRTVLDTQIALNGELQTWTHSLEGLSAQLVSSDPDLRAVFANGVLSAQQLQTLLQQNETALPVILSNLVSLGQLQEVRLPGLREILALYPSQVANGFLTAAGGYAHFGMVLTNSNPICTKGYRTSRQWRNNAPPQYGGPADLNTYCKMPHNGGPQQSDVRGARNSPRPPGDDTASPPPGGYQQLPGAHYPTGPSAGPPHRAPNGEYPGGSGSGGSGSGASGGTAGGTSGGSVVNPGAPLSARGMTIAPYNPSTGLITAPNGKTYRLQPNSESEARYLGKDAWQWLLIAPMLG
jgi:phospholipid/cholesterol/gamma-HCH transport system substrate-binding protein